MSRDGSDESRSSRDAYIGDRSLPPIREVFRDELDRPARPNPYFLDEVKRALPVPGSSSQRNHWEGYPGYIQGEQHAAATLPPIQYTGHSSQRTINPATYSSHSARSDHEISGRSTRDYTQETGYSYGVLRTSGASGTLTDATPPSGRPQGILRQTAAPATEYPEDLNKRYKCDYCGKRFGMPSHLQIHIRTHTAQKPFACEWPGCDRTFSVRSNMMRHFRSHDKQTGSRQQQKTTANYEIDDDAAEEQDDAGSSSEYFQTGSSSRHQSPPPYYTSSRRK